MDSLAGLIFLDPKGQSDYMLHVTEVTTEEDRRHRNRRFKGYFPNERKWGLVFTEDKRDA